MRRVCAWCGLVLAEGQPGPGGTTSGQPITHGMCRPCADALLRHYRGQSAYADMVNIELNGRSDDHGQTDDHR